MSAGRGVGLRMVALAVAGAILGAPAAAAAGDDPSGFIRNRVSMKQSMGALVSDRFKFEAICKEDCVVNARLVLPSAQAKELGFKGVRKGYYFEVGKIEGRQIDALEWTNVKIPLTAEAKRRIRKARGGVDVHGQVQGVSLESSRYGWASWIRTCKWPRG